MVVYYVGLLRCFDNDKNDKDYLPPSSQLSTSTYLLRLQISTGADCVMIHVAVCGRASLLEEDPWDWKELATLGTCNGTRGRRSEGYQDKCLWVGGCVYVWVLCVW